MADPLANQPYWRVPGTFEWKTVKLLSQTLSDIRVGIPLDKALIHRYDENSSFTRHYFPSIPNLSIHTEENSNYCWGLCNGKPHRSAIVCRLCKRHFSGSSFDILACLDHLRTTCPGLPPGKDNELFVCALQKADALALQDALLKRANRNGNYPSPSPSTKRKSQEPTSARRASTQGTKTPDAREVAAKRRKSTNNTESSSSASDSKSSHPSSAVLSRSLSVGHPSADTSQERLDVRPSSAESPSSSKLPPRPSGSVTSARLPPRPSGVSDAARRSLSLPSKPELQATLRPASPASPRPVSPASSDDMPLADVVQNATPRASPVPALLAAVEAANQVMKAAEPTGTSETAQTITNQPHAISPPPILAGTDPWSGFSALQILPPEQHTLFLRLTDRQQMDYSCQVFQAFDEEQKNYYSFGQGRERQRQAWQGQQSAAGNIELEASEITSNSLAVSDAVDKGDGSGSSTEPNTTAIPGGTPTRTASVSRKDGVSIGLQVNAKAIEIGCQSMPDQASRATSPLVVTAKTDASMQTIPSRLEGDLPLVYVADMIIKYMKLADDLDRVRRELEAFCRGLQVRAYVAGEACIKDSYVTSVLGAVEILDEDLGDHIKICQQAQHPSAGTILLPYGRSLLQRPDLLFAVHLESNEWVPIEDVQVKPGLALSEAIEELFSAEPNKDDRDDMSISSAGNSQEKPNAQDIAKKDVQVQTDAEAAQPAPKDTATKVNKSHTPAMLDIDDSRWLQSHLQRIGIEDAQDLSAYLHSSLVDNFVRFVIGSEKRALSQRFRLKELLEDPLAEKACDGAVTQDSGLVGWPEQLVPYAALLEQTGLDSYAAVRAYIKPTRERIKKYINYVTIEEPEIFPTTAARVIFQIAIEAAYKFEGILVDQ